MERSADPPNPYRRAEARVVSQSDKGRAFRALHHGAKAFIIPNPWDRGSAVLLERLGFSALATTSAGFAFSLGRRDTEITRDEVLEHVASIVDVTRLPVSVDFEDGYAEDAGGVAENYRLVAQAGAVGASIEDATGREDDPIRDRGAAVERVRAAVEAVRALPFEFTLAARAENYLHGRVDLRDTIGRLQAYQEAGADVLYAPGLTTAEEIGTLVREVDRPVNVLMPVPGARFSLAELSALGVKRVSVGSALSRAAYGGFLRAAKEMRDAGTFTFGAEAVPFADLSAMFEP
jgi:2-methylisocitrate lyase-like PEP mutase family enzyme